ncbi:kinase-like protein [Trichoderma reesei RUT C-30]|jgi:serum/glucocorticoid-regulated kinase 2|uniref:Kinase-like protein n=2 Tax=Hypocrea jecorina TaxID=51453 RepID=A0A024SJQ9_HYPJR|nr:kinase-like protein [Trichoderma reesei RUT C-30]
MAKRERSPTGYGPQPEEAIPSPSRPGILTVVLHEGTGLSIPGSYKEDQRPDQQGLSKRNTPYAVLDYDRSQQQADSDEGTAEDPVWVSDIVPWRLDEVTGEYRDANWKFDVCRPAELAIHLYLRDPHASPCVRSQDACIGVARIPIDVAQASASEETPSQWVDVEGGTGRLRVSIKYDDTKDKTLEAADFIEQSKIQKGNSGYTARVIKKDTRQRYTTRTIPAVRRPQNADHPFIAPLTLVFQSQEGLHLLSPTMCGGYLFQHLQNQRVFSLKRARIYAAEILCALEYLHESRGIYSWLKPRNVLLDSLGHVVLCGSGLYDPGVEDDGRGGYGLPEYPAPEILRDQNRSGAADWWTLGIFIYEMLTGLPPFFHENADEIRRQILSSDSIQFPDDLPPDARDVIAKLLDRKPDFRLGARGGASEVKEHPFFADIDCGKLKQREYTPSFKPGFSIGDFKQHGVEGSLRPVRQDIYKERYDMQQMSLDNPEPESNFDMELDDAAIVLDPSHEASNAEADDHQDDGWELVWEADTAGPGQLFFRHQPTGEKKPIPTRADGPSHEVNDANTFLGSTVPSTTQKLDALEAALQAGHDHIVSQIVLEHGIDLNIRLFGYQRISPLEWAVDHENLRLVRLLINNGADVDFPGYEARVWGQGGPLMVRAVATKNRKLVELLLTLSKTMNKTPDRVDLTRALGLAVDQRDAAMARILLANGARCDFEDGDRPLPENGLEDGCNFYDISEPTEFIPPLARAVKMGNVGMVRLLLERGGADPNVGYHDLTAEEGKKDIKFRCGRVIELAMELKRQETVKLLLAAGADLRVERPVWRVPGHTCSEVSRAFHQSITARLRTAEELLKKPSYE